MKKIIRLTESDLMRLVKRVINEQGLSTSPWKMEVTDPNTYKKDFIGKTVNFYHDKENKQINDNYKITNIKATHDGEITLDLTTLNRFDRSLTVSIQAKYNCNYDNGFNWVYVTEKSLQSKNMYSTPLENKLKKDFCMKNKSGVQVPKADFASTNNSQNDLS